MPIVKDKRELLLAHSMQYKIDVNCHAIKEIRFNIIFISVLYPKKDHCFFITFG